ncbi:MAG: oligoendopeptidase [Chloroflexota bacterium]|nr:oligoendopeptidase [Chloroflexota bacterium]
MKYALNISGAQDLLTRNWVDFEPAYSELLAQELNAQNLEAWLADWTTLSEWGDEFYNRLYVAVSTNTVDEAAEKLFENYMGDFYPKWQAADQKMKEKFLASGLTVEGFEIPRRNMQAEVDLFCEENLPLFVEEEKINSEHDKTIGAQTLTWQGQEKTARQMEVVLRETDRETRRQGWEKLAERQLQDRQAINDQWVRFMKLRLEMAANAKMPDYRAFRWRQFNRFDYTPEDCKSFHRAIEEVVVPAVGRVTERRKQALGIDSAHYYDLLVDPSNQPPLKPFKDVQDMIAKSQGVFAHVHPKFGEYFAQMAAEGLLDLDNRKNKANGGYTTYFSHARRPFIFANAVGIHDDVQTLLHEGGHSFHAYEAFRLPYYQQFCESNVPTEFAEVASMAMEYLTAPFLGQAFGGFYSEVDAARARAEHIESDMRFWPYMAIVDAFQHWVYENPEEGIQPDRCDAKWAELERRFRPEIDWTGYEDVMMTGWQRKDHIHSVPFYYVEYGLALLGSVQVWRNALADQQAAVEKYRNALALGGTASLPDLFRKAGAKLAFDSQTLQEAVDLMEEQLLKNEQVYSQA